jgi:hypothetical protein
MIPYLEFEGVHKKLHSFKKLGTICTTPKMLPISTTRKLVVGCFYLIKYIIITNVTNFNYKKIGLLDAST